MFCHCEECGDFTVPPLVMPSNPEKSYCPVEPYCAPFMPQCVKVPIVYCCERPRSPCRNECQPCCPPPAHRTPREKRPCDDCDYSRCRYPSPPPCPPPQSSHRKNHSPQRECDDCGGCCSTPCKPVRTKYVIPCYRYEDGRIVSSFAKLFLVPALDFFVRCINIYRQDFISCE